MAILSRRPARIGAPSTPCKVECCIEDHVHITFEQPIREMKFEDPDDAFEFAQRVLRAYDEATGIAPPPIQRPIGA